MITPLAPEDVQNRWRLLADRLVSGLHPSHGDPIHAAVPVAVYEATSVHTSEFYDRLERARLAAGGDALYVIDYDPTPDGTVRPADGYRVVASCSEAWSRAGREVGWTLNGASFAFTDDTARWVVLSFVETLIVACTPDLVTPLFGSLEQAAAALADYQRRFAPPPNLPAFHALASYGRLPEAPAP